MIKLFKTYLKKYKWLVLAAFLLVLLQVFASLKLPDIMSDIVDVGIVNGDVSYILQRGLVMLLWALGSMAAVVLGSYVVSRTSMGLGRDIRADLFRKVMSFSTDTHNEFGSSSLITRNTNDVQQVERFLNLLLTMALMTPLMFFGAIIMSLSKSVQISLVVFSAIPIIVVVLLLVMRKGMPILRSLQKKIDALNRVTREGLTGIRVIRAYNKEAYEEERFRTANRDLADTNIRIGRLLGTMMPILLLIMNFATIAALMVGANQIGDGVMEVGDLMAVIQYASMVLMSVMLLSMPIMLLPRCVAACERINEVLSTNPTIVNPASPKMPQHSACNGEVHFNNVSFTFKEAEEPTLKELNFSIPAGKTTAIIGATGSGKSTIAKLIMRFSDVSEGSITLDGVDVRDFDLKDLRDRISFVPQKAMLFKGTIASNIRYSNEAATNEDVARAAEIAQVSEFALSMDGGYDAQVSQGGSNLSGGQRQRVAIARALARTAELYIFDDSFSALDLKTDALVREGLRERMAGKTMVIVAQRINVAIDADQVVVLDEGGIAGIGTHEELLETCAVYREIVLSQLSEEEAGLCASSSPSVSNQKGGEE